MFPEVWRHPVGKPGLTVKIWSVTCALRKITKKMVTNRISYSVENKDLLAKVETIVSTFASRFLFSIGATEIAGLDNDGPAKMQGRTLQDWTL